MYENAQAAYTQQEQLQKARLGQWPGLVQGTENELLDCTQPTQAPGLITILRETEKQAAALETRLSALQSSLFGPTLNSGEVCGNAKNAHVPSAKETVNAVSKTLDRIANVVTSLEQQIGGR